MNWNQEDIKLVEKFIEIKNKGYYCDGKQLTEVYNRVLEKNVNVTNCGTCLRGRVSELEAALKHFKSLSEKTKVDEVNNDTPVENNEPTEPNNEVLKTDKKRVGRPKKS